MYACILLTIVLASSVAVHWVAASRHWVLAPPSYWEKYAHAHYHLAQSLSLALGLCVVGTIVVWGPFRRRERWSWWALLAVGACLYGSHWINQLLITFTDPPLISNLTQGVLCALYVLGLLLGL